MLTGPLKGGRQLGYRRELANETEPLHLLQRAAQVRLAVIGRKSRLRRGTIYVVVMGVAATVSLIGMSGLMVARLQLRRAAEANAWTEAGDLALAGIELGIARISANATWRTTYTNNTETAPISMGSGTFTFKLVDAALGITGGDGNLNNNAYDPVRLHGIGRVGNTVRAYSVQLIGDVPLDILRTTVATKGYLNVTVPVTAAGGPLSTNGLYTRGDTTTGNVEAGSVTGAGTIYGGLASPSAAKAMPDPTVFDAYRRLATTIPFGGGGNWTMSAPLLSANVNPFSATTNPNGIYYINASGPVTLNITHIKGTLVIDCQDGVTIQINSAMYWEPHTTDLPILLIRHLTTSKAQDSISPLSGTVTEGGTTYPSELRGLVHVIGATGAPSGNLVANLGNSSTIRGTLIVDQDAIVRFQSGTFKWDANLYLNPPVGYSTGPTVKIVTGSMRWEPAP